jgi:ParB family chromosome partitioning protein
MLAGLNPAQESHALARRKAIYEELHPKTKHGGDRRSDQVANLSTRNDRFTESTASMTGKDERSIRRAVARGEALGDDLNDIDGTSLDRGVEAAAIRMHWRPCK